MKKLVLGSAILAVLGMTSSAMAANNSGTVNFTGSVSSATCDLSVQDAAGSEIATVDLGTMATTATAGTIVNFKLVPTDNTCLAKTGAQMNWSSPNLTSLGLSNSVTGGTNAYMKLGATNSTEKTYVTTGNTVFNYTAANGIKSFEYSAQLNKPAAGTLTAGAFATSATYSVAYK
ncbi:TPA: fimbrial protein [Escherichia coli]|nr:fimbrial protein [Escherichia coli]HBA8924910.1 fimbrial protein [Escherichia coli]